MRVNDADRIAAQGEQPDPRVSRRAPQARRRHTRRRRVSPATIGPLERALALRALPPFRSVPARDVAALAQILHEEEVPHGAVLYEPGEPLDALWILTEGRLHRRAHDGGNDWLEAPEALGLLELLADAPAQATVIAEDRVRALVIERSALLELLDDRFTLVLGLRAALGHEIVRLEAKTARYALPGAPAGAAPLPCGSSDLVERLLVVRSIADLRPLGVAVLSALVRENRTLTFGRGEKLLAAGDEPTRFLVLCAGEVQCTPPSGGGAFRAGPGVLLGRDAVLSALPYAYNAVAVTPGQALAIDAQVFWDIAEDHSHVARAALAMSARRLLSLGAPPGDMPRTGARQ